MCNIHHGPLTVNALRELKAGELQIFYQYDSYGNKKYFSYIHECIIDDLECIVDSSPVSIYGRIIRVGQRPDVAQMNTYFSADDSGLVHCTTFVKSADSVVYWP